MTVTWSAFKTFVDSRSLSIQWIDVDGVYWLKAFDSSFALECQLLKSNANADLADFETNYKALGNVKLSQMDTDGAQIVRLKAARRGWSFWSVPIEIVTATMSGSLFCQDSLGVSIPWINAKIYDGNDREIMDPGLANINLATAVKTVIDFEPPFDFEIIGGSLRINSNPSQDVRLWIVAAPDIPAQLGGSKEFASGVNLKFMSADNSWDIDGRVSKAVTYDPVYHSGKVRMIIKHPAGLQVNVMFVAQLFRQ